MWWFWAAPAQGHLAGLMVLPHNWVGSLPEGIWFQTMLVQMNALADTASAICSTGNPSSGPLMKCSQHITMYSSPYRRFHAVGIMRECYLKMNSLQKYHISWHKFAWHTQYRGALPPLWQRKQLFRWCFSMVTAPQHLRQCKRTEPWSKPWFLEAKIWIHWTDSKT